MVKLAGFALTDARPGPNFPLTDPHHYQAHQEETMSHKHFFYWVVLVGLCFVNFGSIANAHDSAGEIKLKYELSAPERLHELFNPDSTPGVMYSSAKSIRCGDKTIVTTSCTGTCNCSSSRDASTGDVEVTCNQGTKKGEGSTLSSGSCAMGGTCNDSQNRGSCTMQ